MNFLAQISLGPVQGFIGTARRSRDLWFGSYILSEISKAAALDLQHCTNAKLIFPFTSSLETQLQPDTDFLVTNIIFCELTGLDGMEAAKAVLEQACIAAEVRWQALCTQALAQISEAAERHRQVPEKFYEPAVWTAQLRDVVEVFQGIVPMAGQSYFQANERLRQLVGNRKNTRSFAPYADNFQRPKSSLDGAQSTVIREAASTEEKGRLARLRQRLGVENGEQLDTAAMVKRVVGRERGFLPTSRVAAQDWIMRVAADSSNAAALGSVRQLLEGLASDAVGTKLIGKYAEYPWVGVLPLDGQLLYRHRIEAERALLDEYDRLERTAIEANRDESVRKKLSQLDALLTGLYERNGAPEPYYGLLLADGDKMGKLIDHATAKSVDGERHRRISEALSAFAQAVPRIMSTREGACIYSGGDDVLGLVPVQRAIEIADALQSAFAKTMAGVASENNLPGQDQPTLSVGIAIVHFLEPLGDVRNLASEAEKMAKGSQLPVKLQRNALGIIAKPRSGNAMHVRIRWDNRAELERLARWTTWLAPGSAQMLPRGLPSEIDEAFRRSTRLINPAQEFETFKTYWLANLQTILDKKRADGNELSATCKQDLIRHLCTEATAPAVHSDSLPLQHLLLARWLSGQADATAR